MDSIAVFADSDDDEPSVDDAEGTAAIDKSKAALDVVSASTVAGVG